MSYRFLFAFALIAGSSSAASAQFTLLQFAHGQAREGRWNPPALGQVYAVRYPSLDEYVLGYLSGSPMAAAVDALEESARQEILERMRAAMQDYVDDDGMAAPWESHVVTAHT